MNIAIRSVGRFASRLPDCWISPASGSMLPDAPQSSTLSGPDARNGLSLARNGCSLSEASISGVNGPDLLLRFATHRFHSSFDPSAPLPRFGLRPFLAASSLLARCRFHDSFVDCFSNLRSPLGLLPSRRIKAFCWSRRQSARLPSSPDFPSLPTAGFYL